MHRDVKSSTSSSAGRIGLVAVLAAAGLALLPSTSADARLNGHPGATGRDNGGTCNRCHSPQTYNGLSIVIPAEYRRDCYQQINNGYQLVNSFYVLPYSPQSTAEARAEFPIKLVLDEPPVDPAEGEVGIFCPTEAQVLPTVECTTPADCPAGATLCKDYGATVTELEYFGLPGDCTTTDPQDQIEEDCGEAGALCANGECARRVTRAVSSCGRQLPACQPGNWAGFAIEVTGVTAENNMSPVLKPETGETGVKQAGAANGVLGSLTELNHSEPRAFENGTVSWDLLVQTPRFTPGNAPQSMTLYASANACNHNFAADVGDVTAITEIPVYFEIPGGERAHTGPECIEGEVCKPGQFLDENLACQCPNGFALGDSDGDGNEVCESAGFCRCTTTGEGPYALGAVAALSALAFLRRRRR